MLRAWRLTFAMQRLELRILLGASAVLATACLLIAWQTNEVRADFLACMQQAPPGSNQCSTSHNLNDLALWGSIAKPGALLAPLVLGLFLGVPVVAREIEGRTAAIAWSLDPSRRRWLVQRAAPVVAVTLIAAVAIGIAGEVLTHADPFGYLPLGPGFTDYGSRIGQVPIRAIAVLSLAILTGALVPRQLPALLVTGVTAIAIFAVLTIGMNAWMQSEQAPMDIDKAGQSGARFFEAAYRVDATGEVISLNEYYSRFGQGIPEEDPEGMTLVAMGVPADRYGVWILRESAIVGALALGAAAMTFVVVQRRRPG